MSRKKIDDLCGIAIIATVIVGLSFMIYGCYHVDKAHGISWEQSLRNNGL